MTFNHIWQTIRGEWQYPWGKHLFLQKKRNKPVVTLHTVLDFWWGIISEQQWIKIHTTLRIDGNHFLSGTCIQFNSTPSRMNLFIQEAELLNRLLSNKYIYDCHLSNWQVINQLLRVWKWLSKTKQEWLFLLLNKGPLFWWNWLFQSLIAVLVFLLSVINYCQY